MWSWVPPQDEDWSVCRNTGFRQPISCLLLPQDGLEGQEEVEEARPSARRLLGRDSLSQALQQRRLLFEIEGADAGANGYFDTFQSCSVEGGTDASSVSVLLFMGVCGSTLALTGPLAYYRKLATRVK